MQRDASRISHRSLEADLHLLREPWIRLQHFAHNALDFGPVLGGLFGLAAQPFDEAPYKVAAELAESALAECFGGCHRRCRARRPDRRSVTGDRLNDLIDDFRANGCRIHRFRASVQVYAEKCKRTTLGGDEKLGRPNYLPG